MLQEGPTDLTKHIASWAGYLGYLAPLVFWLVQTLRKGVKSEDKERDEEIERAVKPYKERAESAERLSATYEKERNEERAAHERCEERSKRLDERLGEERDSKDRLQERVMLIQGRQDEVERRLDAIEHRRK